MARDGRRESSDSESGPAQRALRTANTERFEGSPRDRVVMDEYRRLGHWAQELVELMVERLFAGGSGTLIDIGANIGLVCVPVIERTRAQGVCFEPEPQNFDYLQRNVARHGLTQRIQCRRAACHASARPLPLVLSRDNLGDHRLQRAAHRCAGARSCSSPRRDSTTCCATMSSRRRS